MMQTHNDLDILVLRIRAIKSMTRSRSRRKKRLESLRRKHTYLILLFWLILFMYLIVNSDWSWVL